MVSRCFLASEASYKKSAINLIDDSLYVINYSFFVFVFLLFHYFVIEGLFECSWSSLSFLDLKKNFKWSFFSVFLISGCPIMCLYLMVSHRSLRVSSFFFIFFLEILQTEYSQLTYLEFHSFSPLQGQIYCRAFLVNFSFRLFYCYFIYSTSHFLFGCF